MQCFEDYIEWYLYERAIRFHIVRRRQLVEVINPVVVIFCYVVFPSWDHSSNTLHNLDIALVIIQRNFWWLYL